MNPTEMKLDDVLSNRDDNLEVIENQEDKNDSSVGDSGDSGDNVGNDDNTPDHSAGDSKDDNPDEGFTAKELEEEVEDVKEDVKPTPQNLDPETQYIVDNLPDITTNIIQDGKTVSVSVKSWTQLPQDVEFASKRDELGFINAITAQENRARDLQTQYRNSQQTKQNEEFEQRENAAIRDDISELQDAGLIPKFKANPSDSNFTDDPGAKAAQEVMDFMNKKNAEYLERYNSGAAYRHIGFAEAYYMMPKIQEKAKQDKAQADEDNERHSKADRVAGNDNNGSPAFKRPTVPRGTSLDAIVDRIEQTW